MLKSYNVSCTHLYDLEIGRGVMLPKYSYSCAYPCKSSCSIVEFFIFDKGLIRKLFISVFLRSLELRAIVELKKSQRCGLDTI